MRANLLFALTSLLAISIARPNPQMEDFPTVVNPTFPQPGPTFTRPTVPIGPPDTPTITQPGTVVTPNPTISGPEPPTTTDSGSVTTPGVPGVPTQSSGSNSLPSTTTTSGAPQSTAPGDNSVSLRSGTLAALAIPLALVLGLA